MHVHHDISFRGLYRLAKRSFHLSVYGLLSIVVLAGEAGSVDLPVQGVNVAGLDDTVFADTLFGHVRGAFTGADQLRRGMVEEAADGTLFLDEIGDLSIPSQVKLLRLLQEGGARLCFSFSLLSDILGLDDLPAWRHNSTQGIP